ncbi:hypothetical protein [Hymenobacter weizhouensis]|uniref:hypothetical protein n=1 Tax=Hymenobacter sp. YIM 151500-1 TaxID=2987689 RepID=UPI00222699A0|nr:hypothetical protein [Hymenobacter sp. YIM 151500-1]UYZ64297.1 hypothetical protein OIS53_05465 [Hymenobacter sp. YIM 151500-1]
MHNIDRTLQELETGYEFSSQGEYGQEMEFGQEYSNEQEYSQQELELEMAYQLLEVSNEQELNQFLGSMMSRVAGAVQGAASAAKAAASRFVASPKGQAVGQYLMGVGQNTLPQLGAQYGGAAGGALGKQAGTALGSRLGPLAGSAGGYLGDQAGQAAGTAIGGWVGKKTGNLLASNAKRIFGLELESLSPENQELEIARAYVRFASDVTRRASQLARRNPRLTPGQLGQQVLGVSVPQLAPGLLQGGPANDGEINGSAQPARGTWVRRGRTLVIYNV